MIKSIPLAVLIVVLLTGVVFQYYVTSVPDLESPVSVGEVSLPGDGGSISVSLVDSNGKEFYFGIRGDLETPREDFQLFYIRNPQLVPYVHWTSVRGVDERKVLNLLEGWVDQNIAPALQDRLENRTVEGAEESDVKIAAIYEVYRVLRDRNGG